MKALHEAVPRLVGLKPLHEAMQRLVDDRILAGVSSAVLMDGEVADIHCAGWADRERGVALRADHLFRVFSNTKLVTSCAALLRWEGGTLLERLLGQLAELGIHHVRVLARPAHEAAVRAVAGDREARGLADHLRGAFAGDPEAGREILVPAERPAAVEVAVYRIVADALAAVSRRAVAEPVEVSVGVEDGALVVQVAATGGLASGSGTADLAAQRERAEELGGTWSIDERGGITMITAVLPVAEEVAGVA